MDCSIAKESFLQITLLDVGAEPCLTPPVGDRALACAAMSVMVEITQTVSTNEQRQKMLYI